MLLSGGGVSVCKSEEDKIVLGYAFTQESNPRVAKLLEICQNGQKYNTEEELSILKLG